METKVEAADSGWYARLHLKIPASINIPEEDPWKASIHPHGEFTSISSIIFADTVHTCLKSSLQLFDADANPSETKSVRIIGLFNEIGQIEKAEKYFEKMERSTHLSSKYRLYDAIIKAFHRVDQWDKCKFYFDRMNALGVHYPPSMSCYMMINVCGKAKDVQGAITYFNLALNRSTSSAISLYAAVMRACIMSGDPDNAMKYFKMAKQHNVNIPIEVYGYLIPSMALFFEFENACILFEQMKDSNLKFKMKDECNVIKKFGAAEAWPFLVSLHSYTSTVYDNVTSWNIIFKAYGKRGEIKGLACAIVQMKASHILPNADTFAILRDANHQQW